jgi:hypothetical protein
LTDFVQGSVFNAIDVCGEARKIDRSTEQNIWKRTSAEGTSLLLLVNPLQTARIRISAPRGGRHSSPKNTHCNVP